MEKLVSLAIANERVSLLPQNEFRRKMHSTAQSIDVRVEELREVIVPIIQERFDAMISLPEANSGSSKGVPVSGGPFDPGPNHQE